MNLDRSREWLLWRLEGSENKTVLKADVPSAHITNVHLPKRFQCEEMSAYF